MEKLPLVLDHAAFSFQRLLQGAIGRPKVGGVPAGRDGGGQSPLDESHQKYPCDGSEQSKCCP